MKTKQLWGNEFKDDWFNIKETLEYFSLNISNHIDSLYDDVSFDELGIDVGIDKNQGLWLFEVNWRPGPPVIYNCELDVAKTRYSMPNFYPTRTRTRTYHLKRVIKIIKNKYMMME